MTQAQRTLTPRTMQAIWRDKAHALLLKRMQVVAAKSGHSLYSDSFSEHCLARCITREYLHQIFTGKKRLSPQNYEIIHKRLSDTERSLGIKPAQLITWWKLDR